MDRRKFIIGSSAFITMVTLSSYSLIELEENKAKDKLKRLNPNHFKEPILKAIAYGISASNPHNTQAWKFKLLSEDELLLFVDAKRILPETDPTTRQIHIGCGCFLETASIGMTQEGFTSQIEYFPKGNYKKNQIGKFPVAKLTLKKKNNVVSSRLNNVLLYRKTSRLQFYNTIINNST